MQERRNPAVRHPSAIRTRGNKPHPIDGNGSAYKRRNEKSSSYFNQTLEVKMNGELETGAYKPEAAGSREVIVDVCETALLAALIGVSGSFKIPGLVPGTEFQLSAPIAVAICGVFGFKKYIIAVIPSPTPALPLRRNAEIPKQIPASSRCSR